MSVIDNFQGDKRRLSSYATIVVKFLIPLMWSLLVVPGVLYALIESGEPAYLFWLVILFPLYLLVKIKFIQFDDSLVYISNGFKTKVFLVKDLKSINPGEMFSFDPWFELEFYGPRGERIKFDFMPHTSERFAYSMAGKLTGRLKELDDARKDSVARQVQ